MFAPELVAGETAVETGIVIGQTRIVGGHLADLGNVAVVGLVLCLCGVPPLRGPFFWVALSLFGGLLFASRTRSSYVALMAFLVIGVTQGRVVASQTAPRAARRARVRLIRHRRDDVHVRVSGAEPGEYQHLSDRIPLWQHLTSTVMREAPLTGLGYYAASRVHATEYNAGLGDAHSAFFEVLVGGGLLGAALYLVLCGVLIWFSVRLLSLARDRPSAVAAVGLLSAALMSGLTQGEALHAGPMGFAFWSTTALLPGLLREANRARTAVAEPRPQVRKSDLRLRPATMMAWRDSRFRSFLFARLVASAGTPPDARRLRGGQARGDASWSSSDQMESARLPSHVRCWPIIADRPRFHFLPPLDGRWQSAPDLTSVPRPKARGGGSAMLGWIRLVRNAVRCWLGH